MVVAHEGVKHMAIGFITIAPKVLPHDGLARLHLCHPPRQGHSKMPNLRQFLQCNVFGLKEGFEHARTQPRVLLSQ